MKYEIKHIKPAVFARMTGIAFAVPCLIAMLLWFLIMLVMGGFMASYNSGYGYSGMMASMGLGVIFAMLLGILLVYALGIVTGLLFAVIYNWIAERSMGIELEIDLAKDQNTANKP